MALGLGAQQAHPPTELRVEALGCLGCLGLVPRVQGFGGPWRLGFGVLAKAHGRDSSGGAQDAVCFGPLALDVWAFGLSKEILVCV